MSNSISNNICQCNRGVNLLDSTCKEVFFYNSEPISYLSVPLVKHSMEAKPHKDLSGKSNNSTHLFPLGFEECYYDALRIWQDENALLLFV